MSGFSWVNPFCFFICLSLFACQKKGSNEVNVAVKLDHAANAKLELVTFNLLNFDNVVLAATKLDGDGSGHFDLPLDHPIFALIRQGNTFIPIFLSPGDKQTVLRDSAEGSKTPEYGGDGKALNEYNRKVNAADGKYRFNDHRLLAAIETDRFLARRDSLDDELANLFTSFKKNNNVSKQALQIMQTRNEVLVYSLTQDYITAKFGYDLGDPEVPNSLKNLVKKLPQDSLGLASNMFSYGMILLGYLQSGIIWPAGDRMDSITTDGPQLDLPTFSDEEIELKHFSRPVEDYLKAANINYWVGMEGLSKEVDLLWTKYQTRGANPLYLEAIRKSFDQWALLAPGKPAPDFTGTTPDGKSISLSSLKGQLVYIDVWATWCGPCREEFPHSKKLMKAFEGNDKIVFLYVSTDSKIDLWKKLLPDKSIPAGIHMHQKQDGQPDAIWENYHLWGIPRYILIDAEGKMLETHAPRPRSDDILPLLKGYLKKS